MRNSPYKLYDAACPNWKYLGINNALWGVFLMLRAAARNFTELAVLRAFSVAAEACSDPSFMLITSMWSTRRQQPVCIGIWYTANSLGIDGGGLQGYGIGHTKASLPSWKNVSNSALILSSI